MKPPVPSGAGGLIRSVTGSVTGGGILTRAAAQAMLNNGFCVDPFIDGVSLPTVLTTPAGNVYCKSRNWNDPNNQDEQSLAFSCRRIWSWWRSLTQWSLGNSDQRTTSAKS